MSVLYTAITEPSVYNIIIFKLIDIGCKLFALEPVKFRLNKDPFYIT